MAIDPNIFKNQKTFLDYAQVEQEFQAKKEATAQKAAQSKLLQDAQIQHLNAQSQMTLSGGIKPAALQINSEIEKRIASGDLEGAQRIADSAKIYDKGLMVYGNQSQSTINPPQNTQLNPMLPALVKQESGGNPNALSPKGAAGTYQIMPDTAIDPGFNVQPLQSWDGKDPRTAPQEEQQRFANDYLNAMQERNGGDPRLAAASYNAGPGRVDAALTRLPAETQNYVKNVASRQGYDAALANRKSTEKSAVTQAEYDVKKVEEPSIKYNTGLAEKNATQVGKNQDALGNLDSMTFGIQEARALLPKVSMTGPILGRLGSAAENPDYRNLQGAVNSIVLQAKDLYNLGSGQGFTDADRNFLQEVIAGKYARADTISLGLDRMERALANRQQFLIGQTQNINSKYNGSNGSPYQAPTQNKTQSDFIDKKAQALASPEDIAEFKAKHGIK